ncbi:hypothetical protein [Caballeronia zhejiangensis]|uniref:hypothetical protein n=1 Tax=Caballeronia zhejiangensis TaxID=871203 RepID=UPI001FD22CF9|nr:hypothetical protein [Caballeronia zhejiangensis]
MAKAYKPTAEQEAVVEAAKGGGELQMIADKTNQQLSSLGLVEQLTATRLRQIGDVLMGPPSAAVTDVGRP